MDKVNQFHFILAVCWLLYVVIHSVMAARSFKRMVEQAAGKYYRYYRIVYSITAAVTLILVLAYQFSHYSPALYTPRLLHYLAGIPLAGAGLVIMALCVKKYFINIWQANKTKSQ